MTKSALIVVDVQRDFCAGGALAAWDTQGLMVPLRACIETARQAGAVIVFTKDWHPTKHGSFEANGGLWPVHCVAETAGAELMPLLRVAPGDLVIHKGVAVDGAGYSGFDETKLEQQLRELNVERVGVTGIATEYCVRATALDALKAGFETTVLKDMIRPVEAGATQTVLGELERAGARMAESSEWIKSL
jgi:nicotinamidase/pyrazinamidase